MQHNTTLWMLLLCYILLIIAGLVDLTDYQYCKISFTIFDILRLYYAFRYFYCITNYYDCVVSMLIHVDGGINKGFGLTHRNRIFLYTISIYYYVLHYINPTVCDQWR